MKLPRSQLASSAGVPGTPTVANSVREGTICALSEALCPLDALQNVLGAVFERAVGRGLILEEDGHECAS